MSSIEIIKYKPINKNSLIAYVDIYMAKNGLEIFGCAYHKKNGQEWINLPTREFTNKEGEKKFLSVVRFRERSHQDALSKAVIEEIKKLNHNSSNGHGDNLFDIQEDVPF